MMIKRRHCKLVAFFLLLVLLVPFVPAAPASADVEQPEFPYGVSIYHSTNTGSFALWKVYGSDNVSYVQTYSNVFGDGVAFPVVFRSGLSWTGYYYYINYEKIIDTWDNEGNHIDGGYPWSKNIRIPAPNEATVDSDVYATLVYCTTDIYHGNGYGDDDIYAYQNFIVPSYADPTPTPTPEPEIDTKFPTFINAYAVSSAGSETRYENLYLLCNRYYDEANTRYEYQYFVIPKRVSRGVDWKWHEDITPHYDSYDFVNNIFTAYFTNINPDHNYDIRYGGSFFTSSNYKTESDIYDLNGYVSANSGSKMTETTTRNYQFSISEPSMNYEATAVYTIAPDGSTTRLDGDGGDTPAGTPTPTPRPTVIPQPSISPIPTDPPETGTDDNYTGLFGWLKRIRDAILNIPKKIVNGILDALKYIFIPDINKVKEVYNTLNDMFGVQPPSKFVPDPDRLFRPDNVVWKFHPISLNGEETETTDITLIDFEKVDKWLDSSPGMVITHLLKAIFSITMFAYLVYIFTKHIATINYTDAHTLMHLDDPPKGGKGP